MEYFDIIGTIAAALSLLALLPMIIHGLRNPERVRMSLRSLILSSTGLLAWSLYGFILSSPELVLTSLIVFVPLAILTAMKWQAQPHEKANADRIS